MATTLQDKMKAVGPERREKIEARAAELIAEEMALRDLRKAHHLTQQRMAEFLGIGQEGVSRIEKRSDLLLSTLASYVEAMGGHLRLVAEFPDRPPVALTGFSAIEEEPPASHRKASKRSGDAEQPQSV
jgi:transcriptional regulator with XRE-family HTH domain